MSLPEHPLKPSLPTRKAPEASAELSARLEQLGALLNLGHNALKGTASNERNSLETLPHGWTILIHGTDTERWELGKDRVKIVGMGLSAITAEDAARARADALRMGNPKAYDTTRSYTRGKNLDARPVEIRTFFYGDDLASNRAPKADVAEIAKGLGPEMRRLISKYYQPRHPVIPHGEVLLRIGEVQDDTTGRIVEYFVPESVAAGYVEAVRRTEEFPNTK